MQAGGAKSCAAAIVSMPKFRTLKGFGMMPRPQ